MIQRIRESSASAGADSARADLKSLSEKGKLDDTTLRREVQEVLNRLSKIHGLKEAGPLGIADVRLREDAKGILRSLRELGLFLVPVGELESWVPIVMKGNSKLDKSRWAILAAQKIEEFEERNDDVWEFVRSVYEFIKRSLDAPSA